MYEAFYGFREKPFSLNPDPAYLFKSRKHSMGLTMLEYGLSSEAGIIILTGEVGSGKTTLIRKLLQRVSSNQTVGLMTHISRQREDIFPWISLAFGLERQGRDTVSLFEDLGKFLRKEHQASRRVALIVDEAQNLSFDDLDEMRMLSNINVGKDLFLQLVLVGQPELLKKLQRPELRQLAQRVSVDYHLEPLNAQETTLYIHHRINVAGGDPDIFDARSCALVHRQSGGIPRLINVICDAALVYGFADERRSLDEELVKVVIHDRGLGAIAADGATRSQASKSAKAVDRATLNLSELPDRLTRAQAAEYLSRRHGIPIKESTLYHRQTEKTGPRIEYFGRKPLYPVDGLDEWAAAVLRPYPKGISEARTRW